MSTFLRYAKRFLLAEDGPTATEYAVMLALIVIVCIGAITGIGQKVDSVFTSVDNGLPTGTAS
jgi:pilus assembly protein Flp/PilA